MTRVADGLARAWESQYRGFFGSRLTWLHYVMGAKVTFVPEQLEVLPLHETSGLKRIGFLDVIAPQGER